MTKEIKNATTTTFKLLEDVKQALLEVLIKYTNEAFENYPILCKEIKSEILSSINEQALFVQKTVTVILDGEKACEWTINPYYMDTVIKTLTEIKKKKEKIEADKIKGIKNIDITPVLINDNQVDYNDIFTTNVLKYHNDDDDEMCILNLQVACFAYFKVFEKRFVDTYQMLIMNNMIMYHQKNLAIIIEKKFSPTVTHANYIEEDPSILQKRQNLQNSITNLEVAKDELNKII